MAGLANQRKSITRCGAGTAALHETSDDRRASGRYARVEVATPSRIETRGNFRFQESGDPVQNVVRAVRKSRRQTAVAYDGRSG